MSLRDLRIFALVDDPLNARGIRGQLLGILKNAPFTIEHIHEQTQPSGRRYAGADEFGLFLKPRESAKRLYGLDREVLLWCSTHPHFQARDIDKLSAVVRDNGARLSRQFAILVTTYDRGSRSLLEAESGRDQSLVHVTLDELRTHGLEVLLSRHLYSRDLFDVSGATLRATDFFGRRDLIDRISSEIEVGVSQVGIFGLRKVGKTSLLNRIADKLQNSGRVMVARLDLQWTTAINDRPEYTLWAMGESIFASHRAIRALKGLRLFGRHEIFSDIKDPDSIWELFAHDLRLIARSERRRICVLVDEIERMYEEPEVRGFVRFWRLLRGLDQENPGTFRFIVGGTSPQCSEAGQVSGLDNPLFNYLKVEYLGPLSEEDSAKLLNTLGGTMGLHFDESAVQWAMRQCGGHPALLRALGSVVHRKELSRTSPIELGDVRVAGSEPTLRQRVAPVLDQMLASLRDEYPDEYEILMALARGGVHEFREYASEFPSEVRRLRKYGLASTKEPPSIPIKQLHAHLLAASQPRSDDAVSTQSVLQIGEKLGEWEITSILDTGGHAVIYRVENQQDVAAAKVITRGQLSYLQRELEIVQELSHPGIVRFHESLLYMEQPCLIMEYLEGLPASSYCTPSAAPVTTDLVRWIRQLLEALKAMHPRRDLVRRFEQEETLDSASYNTWSRAKHGYVHRDIKPENIMIVPDRGPVLIDFGISVRAGSPVHTQTASTGYLPGLAPKWESSVDLFALGLTTLELAAGQRHYNCSRDELQEIARSNHGAIGDRIVDLATKMIEAPETDVCAADLLLHPVFRRR